MSAEGVKVALDLLIALGIAVFVISLILALNYSSFAQTRNTLVTQYGASAGVVSNYTTNAGNINNTYGTNTNLAVFALVFITIIIAVLLGIRSGKIGGGGSGGFL